MASGSLDSAAVFKARALAINVAPDVLQMFIDGGITTMATYAFAAQFTPGSSDERPLVQLISDILTRPPSVVELACLRRL